MALYALPIINQGSLPAGVAGQSRDDLALGQPVIITDSGAGPTRAWVLLDKPEGSNAVLSSGSGPVTQFTPDVAGSYRVQLQVNGGPTSDHIDTVIAAVQLALPSWITGPSNKVRIPAWGERLEFNVKSSPGSGSNKRGWAYEMEQFFRTIASYGFGIVLKEDGSLVTGEPSYEIDFQSGLKLTDLGGGMIGVSLGDHNELSDRNASDCHPASSISLDDSGFTDNLVGVTDVQQMAAIVDGFTVSSLMVANTIFVTKGGDDSTGQRGNKSKPFLTIDGAFGVAQDGDLIFIGPGLFEEGNLHIPDVSNLYVVGSGPGVTVIRPSSLRRMSAVGMDQLLLSGFTFRRKSNSVCWVISGVHVPGGYFTNGGIGLVIHNIHDECEVSDGEGTSIFDCSSFVVKDVFIDSGCGYWITHGEGMRGLFSGVRREGYASESGNYDSILLGTGTFEFKGCYFSKCGRAIEVITVDDPVSAVIDSACEFFNCSPAIVVDSEDDNGSDIDLLISGRFSDSDIFIELNSPYEGSDVYVRVDGVSHLTSLMARSLFGSFNGSFTLDILNSNLTELSIYQQLGELTIGDTYNVVTVLGCNSCFDEVVVLSTNRGSSNSLVEFKNCSILTPNVDGWSFNVRGGYVDTTNLTTTNSGLMTVYSPDGASSQTFT